MSSLAQVILHFDPIQFLGRMFSVSTVHGVCGPWPCKQWPWVWLCNVRSGICCCTRHELIEKNGVRDLQKGEWWVDHRTWTALVLTRVLLRYTNMDYIFAEVMKCHSMALHKIITYNISCQWSIHLESWLKKLLHSVRISDISSHNNLIPKLHILAHKAPWPTQHSHNYQPGCGHTDGEGIEHTHTADMPRTQQRSMKPEI